MKAIEIYKQEIEKQKDPNEKREVARRWLRDMKQRKALVDDPAEINVPFSIKGIKTKAPRGHKYYLNPNGARELKEQWYQNMIDYIQADIEHFKSSGEGKAVFTEDLQKCQDQKTTESTRVHNDITRRVQDCWNYEFEDFKGLLKQLSIVIPFIDTESYMKAREIYDNHFANNIDLCGGRNTKINWKGTWNAYRFFFKISQENDSPLFVTAKTLGLFFCDHFLHRNKEIINSNSVTSNSRGDPQLHYMERLKKITKMPNQGI